VHVLFAEHVAADPQGELGRLLGHLDLDAAELTPLAPPAPAPAAAPLPARTGLSRFWPLAQRAAAPARAEHGDAVDERLGIPRQAERQRNRARGLYSRANRDLAAFLRVHDVDHLPAWLLDA
jgi:hypothetical protein